MNSSHTEADLLRARVIAVKRGAMLGAAPLGLAIIADRHTILHVSNADSDDLDATTVLYLNWVPVRTV